MNRQNKLRTANVLMLLGVAPLIVGIFALFSTIPGFDVDKQSQVGDGLMLLGKVIFAYVFALIVSGTSALWSAALERRHAGLHVRASSNIRILVLIALVFPLLVKAF